MAKYTMNKEEWLAFQSQVFDEMKALTRAKNADYTGGTDDPFANFRESESFGVPVLKALFIRMGDKFQRIKSYSTKGELQVVGEGVDDALRDLIGYSCLALGLIEEGSRQHELEVSQVDEAMRWANEDFERGEVK